jgi:protein TonB
MRNALIGTGIICLLLLTAYYLSNQQRTGKVHGMVVNEFNIERIKESKKTDPIPIPRIKEPRTATVPYTIPRIVNKELKKEEMAPNVDILENTKISTTYQDGNMDDNIVRPAVDHRGVTQAVKNGNDDSVFMSVQIESSYPGGMAAWARYLGTNISYPEKATDLGIQGKVVVSFIVDQQGNTSEVQAIQGPEELRDEAVRVIKKSGQWTPAIQNGRKVKSYKLQPIVFRTSE